MKHDPVFALVRDALIQQYQRERDAAPEFYDWAISEFRTKENSADLLEFLADEIHERVEDVLDEMYSLMVTIIKEMSKLGQN